MNDKKRVLFIAPKFFGYYKEIKNEMEKLNYDVDYFCDAPSNSNISKALGRLNKKLIKKQTNKYFLELYDKTKNVNYDFVFIIAGMSFSFFPEMIEKMKNNNSSAKFVLYQWDGEKNIKFVKDIHKYFDEIFTFDRIDALNDSKYSFLPLFYIDKYENVAKKNDNNFDYDALYIGTAHPKKLFMINKMADELKIVFRNQYIYHYMPSKFKYIYHKIFSKEYKKIKLSDLNEKKISTEEILNYFEKSKCILDAPQDGQVGLTIRTIECLGAKRKLITVNKDIKNYDFYNEKNIYVYDGEIDYNSIFFKSNYEEIPEDIYIKYALNSWIKQILK